MVGPVGFRIRTVGVWCEQFGWRTTSFLIQCQSRRNPSYVPATPESTVESDRRGKRHAGNRGMAAQARDARQDKTVRSGGHRALPTTPYGFTVAADVRLTFDLYSTYCHTYYCFSIRYFGNFTNPSTHPAFRRPRRAKPPLTPVPAPLSWAPPGAS